MSTSLLFHAFGIQGFQLKSTEFTNGNVMFHLSQDPYNLRCPECKSSKVIRRGKRNRTLRSIPIGNKKTFIEVPHQRVECLECGVLRYINLKFAEPKKQHTRAFRRYALSLLEFSTIKDVANHLGTGWDLIKDIDKSNLKRLENPPLKDVTQIAIDEIYLGKKEKYTTIVLDIDTGAIIYVAEGKDAGSLDPFWKKLKRAKASIEAVASDMSPAYEKAITENIPDAAHVTDPFHVVKLFNDKLTQLRRDLYNEATDIEKKNVLKGSRWILLKNPENLRDELAERQRLNDAIELNKPLATAYYLKEELRQMWSQGSKTAAASFIMSWIVRAEQSGVKIIADFAQTIWKHFTSILAHYDFPISTGILEGTNNKIKTLLKRAYGYRDKEYFTLKLFGLHKAKYQLTG